MQFRPLFLASLCTILVPSVPPAVVAPSWNLWRSDPCVPAGESTTKEFDRPPLDSPGMPTTAQWKDGTGNPQAFDADTFSNDFMGRGTPSADGNKATVELKNDGGKIFGPNGADVYEWFEGSCVEVIMEWTYVYKRTVTRCVSVTSSAKLMGVGSETTVQECHSKEVWEQGTVTVGPIRVCAC